MHHNNTSSDSPWLVWLYSHQILKKYNATPRLEITKEMRNLGWKVDLIACGPRGEHVAQGVKVLLFPTLDVYFLRHLIFHMRAIGYIIQNWRQIDVVMFHQMSALWILPLRLLFAFGKKRPIFVMDTRTVTMELASKATGREKLRKLFYSLMSDIANNFADGQTVITKPMAELLQVPKEKLWGTWPSGVNLDEFAPAAKKHCWPTENDPVIIIYIGSMHYGRNLLTLSWAVYEANREGMNFKLVLYGEGGEKQDLQSYADQSGGCIKIFDTILHNQIPDVLAGAHVGSLPFPDEDKFRVSSFIKLFEYMGTGMPGIGNKDHLPHRCNWRWWICLLGGRGDHRRIVSRYSKNLAVTA